MSTYDFTVTANDIIRDALLDVGALDADESPSGDMTTDALRALNKMVKSWQGRLHMWNRQEVVIPVVKDGQSYKLGPASTDAEWCLEDDFQTTLLNGAASASATSLTVDSTANMAVGDRIGIELSDGTRQWTSVKSITSSTVVVVSTALTGAASDDATVFTYTTRPQRPENIIHARRGVYDGSMVNIPVEALNKYQDQPSKDSTGYPVMVAYKPSLTSGTLYVWPAGDSVTNVIKMTIEYPLADFDNTSGNPDFPIEWADALSLNLAVRLDRQYRQLDTARRRELQAQAALALDMIEMHDSDDGSYYFQPARR